ncbi:MAG: TrbI/VirB10 family protein [Treponema sp.]|jgi:type IV secretion system protein VirB10|nr:TrbI/VirB10 family protein [Treponema sp.]
MEPQEQENQTNTQDYELTPDDATAFDTPRAEPKFLDRKKLMMVLSFAFVVVVGGGLLLNVNKNKKQNDQTASTAAAARSPAEFLRTQRDRALAVRPDEAAQPIPDPVGDREPVNSMDSRPYQGSTLPRPDRPSAPPPPAPQGTAQGAAPPSGPDPLLAAQRSPLVPPAIEGSLFGGRNAAPAENDLGAYGGQSYRTAQTPGQAAANDYLAQALAARQSMTPAVAAASSAADPYALQNAQDNKQAFYQSGGGAAAAGYYLGDNAIWIGTMVPGVLETGINTDLPGEVLARVTGNIYDSLTGKNLLIPQGTILIAHYNSSVSYAQKRVQIVWDTLIRPDGFLLDLAAMNGVDRMGFSGQEAEYHENWFEYLKAAGIIALFSIANAQMTAETAKYASSETAAAVAESNTQFVNQMGGNFVSRAMNIQPSLTVESGTVINIMLNKSLYLPPLEDYRVSQKYRLE